MKFLVGVSILSALFLLSFTGSNADTDSNIVSMVIEELLVHKVLLDQLD